MSHVLNLTHESHSSDSVLGIMFRTKAAADILHSDFYSPSWPAVDYDGVFGPVGLLTDDVNKLQDALDGVDRGDAVIRPRGVIQMEDVLSLVGLWGQRRFISLVWSSNICFFCSYVADFLVNVQKTKTVQGLNWTWYSDLCRRLFSLSSCWIRKTPRARGWSTSTHISQSELPDGPLWRLCLWEHLNADLSVHDGLVRERPVVITLHLRANSGWAAATEPGTVLLCRGLVPKPTNVESW